MKLKLTKRKIKKLNKVISITILSFFIYSSYLDPAVHAFVVSNQFKQQYDRYQSGYFTPDTVQSQMNKQKAIVDYQNRLEKMLAAKNEKVTKKIAKNLRDSVFNHEQSMAVLKQEAQAARQKVFAILGQQAMFNYIQYDDGKRVWMKDGLAVLVENERVIDAHGNVSLRNTYNMSYNSKRLLTSYDAQTTDSLGNVTYTKWYGATYTDDSVFYAGNDTHANKLLTSYTQEIIDQYGNKTKVEWTNGQYDGKLLINYNETFTDERGNQSSKHWYGAKYDDQKQVTEFQEDNLDAKGNKTHRLWTAGTYIKNPAYSQADEKAGKTQSASEYLLVGYKEVITDSNGVSSTRIWGNARYDGYGQLVSYQEELIDALGRHRHTVWEKGRYDHYGRLMGYREIKTAIDGTSTTVDWEAYGYETNHRLKGFTQKSKDVLGNVTITDRHHLTYDQWGDVLSYEETVMDPLGIITLVSWQNGLYDRFGRLIGYKEIKTDQKGYHTIHEWGRAVFNSKDQLLSYEESTTDPLGNTTRTVWEQGTYDYLGRLMGYHESATDILGHTSQRWWQDAAYDDLDHQASYTEIREDVFGHRTQTRWRAGKFEGDPAEVFKNQSPSSGYNQNGQLTDYMEEVTDVYGQVSYHVFADATYDRYGRSQSHHETFIGADGSSIKKTWQDAVYNQLSQLISYQELWTYPGGLTSTHDWGDAVYDDFGRLLEVTETFSDSAGAQGASLSSDISSGRGAQGASLSSNISSGRGAQGASLSSNISSGRGNQSTRLQDQTQYNTLNQMTAYHEVINDSGGHQVTTTWQAQGFDDYGRIQDSRQVSVSDENPQVTITTEVHGRAYDSYGEVCGGEELKTTTGTTQDGHWVDLSTKTWYEDVTFQSGLVETRQALSLQGYTQITRTTGLDPQGTQLDWQERLAVTDITAFGRVETRRTVADGLDHTVITTRTAMVRNALGQVTGYHDEVWDQATPAGIMSVERSAMVINSQGQIMGYQELVRDITGLVSERFVSGLLYNGLDQQTASTTLSRRTGQGSLTLPPDWDNLTDEQKNAVLQDQVDHLGNGINWASLSDSQKQALLSGQNVVVGELGTLCLVQEGNQWVLQSLLYLSDLTVRDHITYDVAGRMVGYEENRQSAGNPYQTFTTWQAQGFTSAGLVAAETTVSQTSRPGSVDPGRTTTTIRTNMTYNHVGQILGYDETVTDSQSPDLITTNAIKNRTYDSLGRVAGEEETEHTQGTSTEALPEAGQLNQSFLEGLTLIKAGTEIKWDDLSDADQKDLLAGKTVDVLDVDKQKVSLSFTAGGMVMVQTSMDLTVTRTRNQVVLDSLGRLSGYTETVHTTGNGLDSLETTIRDNIAYNGHHQTMSYHETQWSSVTPGLTLERWMNAMVYDPLGQLTGYDEKTVQQSKQGQGFYLQTLTHRSAMIYTSTGLVAGYTERNERSDLPGVINTTTRSAMSYDDQGHLLAYHETGDNGQGLITTTDVDNIKTDRLGREKSRHETVVTKGYDDQGLMYQRMETRTIDHERYNSLGQKTASITQSLVEGQDSTSTVIWSQGAYNNLGQLQGFEQETRVQGPGLQQSKVQQRLDTQYNALGQLVFSQDRYTDRSAPDKVVLESLQDVSYDQQGRQATFRQIHFEGKKGVDAPQGMTTTTDRTQTSYNTKGQAESYQETRHQTGMDGNQSLDISQSISRDQIITNPAGQVTDYHETVASTATTEAIDRNWSAAFDRQGRMTSSTEIKTQGNTTWTTSQDQISYNTLNQQTGYHETVHQLTQDSQGVLVDLTNTTTRGSMTYDRQGRLVSYQDELTASDSPGLVTTVNHSRQVYDAMGQAVSWEEIQDVTGQISSKPYHLTKTVTRSSTTINLLGQVTGYAETLEEPSKGTLTTTSRDHMTYDEASRLATYHEVTHEQPLQGRALDRTVEISRQSTVYDSQGRLINSVEKKVSSDQSDLIVTTELEVKDFDAANRAVESKQKMTTSSITEPNLNRVVTISKSGITYSTASRESGYTEETTSSSAQDLKTVIVRSQQTYNDYGQMTGYNQEQRRETAATQEVLSQELSTRAGISYNELNQQTAWHEVSTQPELLLTTVTDWTQGTYNSLGQLQRYEQTSTTTGQAKAGLEAPRYTVQVTRSGTSYDNQGRLIGQTEQTQDSRTSGLVSTENLAGITYNNRAEQQTFTRMTDQVSADQSYHVTQTVKRTATGYDDDGRVLSTSEEIRSNATPDLKTLVAKDSIHYDSLQQVTAYTQTTTQQGRDNSTGQEINATETIYKSGQTYTGQGQLKSYHEENSDGTGHKDWQATAWDVYGRNTAYSETGSMPTAGDYTQAWSGSYNALDQVKTNHQTYKSDNGSQDYDKDQTSLSYNSLGQLTGYTEEGSKTNVPKYTLTVRLDFSDSYNSVGQKQHDQEIMTNDLGVVTDKTWSQGAYNGLGQLIGYHDVETRHALSLQDETTTTDWSAAFNDAYDLRGNQTHYVENSTITTRVPDSGDVVDQREENKTWHDAAYNNNNQLTWYVESVETRHALSLQETTATRSGMAYDTAGHLDYFEEIGNGPTTGQYEKTWQADSFDAQGRATKTIENGYSQAGGVNTALTREAITYEGHGWITGYHESGISGGTFEDRVWKAGLDEALIPQLAAAGMAPPITGQAYDALGRILCSTESGWNESGYYEKVQYELIYNLLSRQTAVQEVGWNLGDGCYTRQTVNQNYNQLGQRLYYEQATDFIGKGQHQTLTWRAGVKMDHGVLVPDGVAGYNSKGQLVHYIQDSRLTENNTELEAVNTHWQADFSDSYTDQGQLNRFTSLTVKNTPQGTKTTQVDRSHSLYYADGRLEAYQESTTDTIDDGQNTPFTNTANVLRSGITYYDSTRYSDDNGTTWNDYIGATGLRPDADGRLWRHQGLQAGYQELALGTQASEKPTQTIMDSMTYTHLGQQNTYTHVAG